MKSKPYSCFLYRKFWRVILYPWWDTFDARHRSWTEVLILLTTFSGISHESTLNIYQIDLDAVIELLPIQLETLKLIDFHRSRPLVAFTRFGSLKSLTLVRTNWRGRKPTRSSERPEQASSDQWVSQMDFGMFFPHLERIHFSLPELEGVRGLSKMLFLKKLKVKSSQCILPLSSLSFLNSFFFFWFRFQRGLLQETI